MEISNKGIGVLLLVICLISGVVAYYPGETIVVENEMGIENLVYTIVNNNTSVRPLTLEINSTNIIITFPQDMTPDTFDIVFIEKETEVVTQVVTSSGGGGGTRTRYVDRNITIYEPEYIETIKEVEKKVEVEKVLEDPIDSPPWWMILLGVFAIVIGTLFLVILLRGPKDVENLNKSRNQNENN